MKKKLLTASFVLSLSFISYKAITYSGGPPNGYTNAPGESNCTNCHGGTLNSGTALNNITLTTSAALSNLQPNTTYTFSLSFNQPGRVRYGFQLCVLPSAATSASASIGTLTSTNSQTYTSSSPNPARTYLMHSATGTAAPSEFKTWQFSYTTPAVINSTPVFYVTINASNNDGGSGGDLIYTKTFSSTVLPVKWGNIALEENNEGVNITWSTLTEINNDRFEIEKSKDGYNWMISGTVDGSGNSGTEKKYSFNDAISNHHTFYRIRQVDFSGNHSYSNVISQGYKEVTDIDVLYNFSTKSLLLPDFDFSNIRLTDMKANAVTVRSSVLNGLINIDAHMFKQGIYLLSAELHGQTRYWKVMVY